MQMQLLGECIRRGACLLFLARHPHAPHVPRVLLAPQLLQLLRLQMLQLLQSLQRVLQISRCAVVSRRHSIVQLRPQRHDPLGVLLPLLLPPL